MSSGGRGRGISNAPAWMSRQQRGEQMGSDKIDDGPGGNDHHRGNMNGGGERNSGSPRSRSRSHPRGGGEGGAGGGGGAPERDQYGRIRSNSGGGGPPPFNPRERERAERRRIYEDSHGGGGGGGGGGGPPPPRYGRDGGEDYGPYGPPPPHHRGGRRAGSRDRGGDRYGGGGRDRRDYPPRGGGRRRGGSRDRGGGGNRSGIYFRSLEEERQWVEERRRKRKARQSLFDVEPTPEQAAADARAAALTNFPATTTVKGDDAMDTTAPGAGSGGIYGPASVQDGADLPPKRRSVSTQPQQTRHARRLYIGHLPPDLTEEDVHSFFRDSILKAMDITDPHPDDDPILSVYINHERRFAFVEFKTVEITTACLALDGINILGRGKVKVKRPNDYNPAIAPEPNPNNSINLHFDVSKLGIISGSVPDGPNKIFIGGLHYHLTEDQVMELLSAFGQIRAFHLVKADPTAATSKGYCFVEYADPAVTQIAIMGLNGMDMGGGKVLSARIAAARGTVPPGSGAAAATATALPAAVTAALPGAELAPIAATPAVAPSAAIASVQQQVPPQPVGVVDGVDVNALLDAALAGAGSTPAAPAPTPTMATVPGMMIPNPGATAGGAATTMGLANAALDAAFGGMGGAAPAALGAPAAIMQQQQQQQQQMMMSMMQGMIPMGGTPAIGTAPVSIPPPQAAASTTQQPTRILVLLNMVTDEDLETDDDFQGLYEEVKEECEKFGKLISMKIPRQEDGYETTAIKKIFLEYATPSDAANAERELGGRQFGPNIVQTSYFNEEDYLHGKFK